MKRLTEMIRKTALGKRVLDDPLFRVLITSSGSMGWNLIYALFNGVLAIAYRSFWFLSMFVYYLILGGMRLLVVSPKKDRSAERWSDNAIMRTLGIEMIILAVVVSGIICMAIAEKHNPTYNTVVMITIATYTFYAVTMSIINIVKAHKKKDATMIMLRDITLAGTIVAVLSLERSMLGTFGNAEDGFSRTMEIISGAVAFVLIIGIAISMIVQSSLKKSDVRNDS